MYALATAGDANDDDTILRYGILVLSSINKNASNILRAAFASVRFLSSRNEL